VCRCRAAFTSSASTPTPPAAPYGKDAGAFYATNAQYNTLNNAAGWLLLQKSLAGIASNTWQNPVSTSQAAFAQVDWTPIDRLTITGGLRYTREQKRSITTKSNFNTDGTAITSTGNATADAIRSAQLSTTYTGIIGDPIHADPVAWLVNPSFKISDDLRIYASASGGEIRGGGL
jgi:iron complex outermembrane receptor protein